MLQTSAKKVIGGILQFLIAIPVLLYLVFAILSLVILFFFIVPVVIPIATKIWYLDYVRSTLREVSRSPFYVSLVSTAFSIRATISLWLFDWTKQNKSPICENGMASTS
jgi:hypothetical protein